MDHRRTLASEGPLGNALPSSSLPVPSSAMKKPPARLGGSRMSMLPVASNAYNQNILGVTGGGGGGGNPPSSQQQQQYYQQPQHQQQSHGRMSTASGGGGAGGMGLSRSSSQEQLNGRRSTVTNGGGMGMMSSGKVDGGMYGRTSNVRAPPGSVRRSSVFPGAGRQSMALGGAAISSRDSRPYRDKAFQNACQENVADYLSATRCPIVLTQKTLLSPTQKEFQTIFKFLISEQIDRGYQFTKKFEDECVSIMKDLKYPAMEHLGKTALATPGTPQYWPGFLAMFNWLVDLCKALDSWRDPSIVQDPFLTPVKDMQQDHPNFEDRLLWEFSSKTYQQWFDGGAEEFPEAEAELEEMYERLTQTTFEETEQLETQLQKRRVELQQLQAQEPPLKKLEEEYVQLMGDKTKFIAFIQLHRQKHDRLLQNIARAEAATIDQEKQLEATRVELAQIEAAVAAQNLSPDEVQRMNHERESLQRNLDDIRHKCAEANQFAYDQEVAVTRAMDKFDGLVAEYTSLGHSIGVIKPMPENPIGPDGIDYTVDIELGIEDINEVQSSGSRLRSVIQPGLQKVAQEVRHQVKDTSDEIIELERANDQMAQRLEIQKAEIKTQETRLQSASEVAEDNKRQYNLAVADAQKIEARLVGDVASATMATQEGVSKVQGALESLRIEYQELRHKTTLLQESVTKQMIRHMDIIIKAKGHTESSLKSVRTCAEAQ